MSATPLLKVEDLTITFHAHEKATVAASGVSYELNSGEVLAVVGESGSGKSVSALALTQLLPSAPTCVVSGKITLEGINLLSLSEKEISKYRGKVIAYIFQDPGTSLNPVYSVEFQIAEAIKIHRPEISDVRAAVIQSLNEVRIHEPEKVAQQYPHELSGGMQQRVMIAMALACNPRILVADEPTTALDVTIQKEIIDLLAHLCRQRGMSILLITHNFGIVANFANRVIVMRHGKVVETGSAQHVLENPTHPYTQGLIACIPRLGQKRHRLTTLPTELS
ncbi:MAG: ABC transporter ATP-binding protein [Opitutales bacterium]|jgi:ABC-type dipeptide/oligopeptide/nickel transport system ATPase component|nr:ABC transporter ATP-binding protein [Opitutales bacterium]